MRFLICSNARPNPESFKNQPPFDGRIGWKGFPKSLTFEKSKSGFIIFGPWNFFSFFFK